MAGKNVVAPRNLNNIAQGSSGNKNLVHNGAMLVHQKGGTITLSNDAVTPHIDRFTAYKSNAGTQTMEQSTDVPANEGLKNSLKATCTVADGSVASGDRVSIIHRLEGQHCAHLMWGTANAKTVTLSFFVKSSVTGTHGGAFGNGSDNRAYPFTYTISSANTWERKTITVAGDTSGTWATDNTRSIQICWGLGVGTTNSGTAGAWESADRNSATGATTGFLTTVNSTFFLTGVQLEVGTVATAFEHEPFERTLLKSQRYYQRWQANTQYDGVCTGAMYSDTFWLGDYRLSPEMRAEPTFSANGTFKVNASGGDMNASNLGLNRATPQTIQIECDTTDSDRIGQAGLLRAGADSDAYCEFISEL
jgi:hypothetical protein